MTNGFRVVRREVARALFSFEGTEEYIQRRKKSLWRQKAARSRQKESGSNSGEDTPVPISNTEVKLPSADDTWWETAWESRTLPVWLKRNHNLWFLFYIYRNYLF